MDNKKAVCLHFHIFKNGGTTIEWILKNNFSQNAISIDTDQLKGILSKEIILKYLDDEPSVKSFSSHQIRYPLPEAKNFLFIPLVFFRHPIDRIYSIYNFNRKRSDVNALGVTKAKSLNLNDYIEWNLARKNHRAMKNFQVLFLSDKPVDSMVNHDDFELAVSRMKNCPVIGVVDRFDESLVLGEQILGQYFPELDFSYIKQNVTENRKDNLEERLEEEKTKVEKKVMDEILVENELDLKLYSLANEELNNRIKTIDDFNKKLNNFHDRCNKKNNFSNLLNKFKTKQVIYSAQSNSFYNKRPWS